MLSAIQSSTNNDFSNYSGILTNKPNNPNLGDTFYDTSTGEIFVFDSVNWNKLNVDYLSDNKRSIRMSKIENLFD